MALNCFDCEDVLSQVLASSGESSSEHDRDYDFDDMLDTFSLNSSSKESKK